MAQIENELDYSGPARQQRCRDVYHTIRHSGSFGLQVEDMPFVITEPCIGVQGATCIEVCPVDCINTDDNEQQYFIDPVTCIDCSYCESVCPVNAIFDEFTVPSQWRHFIAKNRDFYKKR